MGIEKSRSSERPDRKTVCLGDTFSEAQVALKKKKARNLSALIRQALCVYLHPERQALDLRPFVKDLDELRIDMARVGSNLNQLAHGFNMHGPAAFKHEALAVIHDDLRGEFRKVMTMLLEVEREIRRKNS